MKKTFMLLLALSMSSSALFAQTWSKELEKKAKSGDVAAQFETGVSYLKGSGTEKDAEKAAKWLQLAAQQGDKNAQKLFNSFYSKALLKLAKSGNAEAQYAVGMALFSGNGIEKNTDEAAEWFEQAMDQGHAEARAMFTNMPSSRRDARYPVRKYNDFTIIRAETSADPNSGHYNRINDGSHCVVGVGDSNAKNEDFIMLSGTWSGKEQCLVNTTCHLEASDLYYQGKVKMQDEPSTASLSMTLLKGGYIQFGEKGTPLQLTFDLDISVLKQRSQMMGVPASLRFIVSSKDPQCKLGSYEKSYSFAPADRAKLKQMLPSYTLLSNAIEAESVKLEVPVLLNIKKNGGNCILTLNEGTASKAVFSDGTVFTKGQSEGKLTRPNGDFANLENSFTLKSFKKTYEDGSVEFKDGQFYIKYKNGDHYEGTGEVGFIAEHGRVAQWAYDEQVPFGKGVGAFWNPTKLSEVEIYYNTGMLSTADGLGYRWNNGSL